MPQRRGLRQERRAGVAPALRIHGECDLPAQVKRQEGKRGLRGLNKAKEMGFYWRISFYTVPGGRTRHTIRRCLVLGNGKASAPRREGAGREGMRTKLHGVSWNQGVQRKRLCLLVNDVSYWRVSDLQFVNPILNSL